jgi:Zn-dependent protease
VTPESVERLMYARLARDILLTIVPVVLSLAIHEFAHAWVATRLGDPTPRQEGRLTLNPAEHADVIGTLLMPVVTVLAAGVAYFGWARPTSFNAFKFHKGVPRRLGTFAVASAGPAANFLLAVTTAALIATLQRWHVPLAHDVQSGEDVVSQHTPLGLLLYRGFEVNVGLALFNLLPIPPLDGHRMLPRIFDRLMLPFERYGLAVLIIGLLLVPSVGHFVLDAPFRLAVGLLARTFGIG